MLSVIVNSEVEMTPGRSSAESAISINPVNPNLVIAGVNGPTGQEMYYSSNGGSTWTRSTSNLGSSCCDPTVGWSPDGTVAYMMQLGTCSSLCNIEFFRSSDSGQTWGNKVTINTPARNGQNDKEVLHVDLAPSSPFLGRIYGHWHRNNRISFAYSSNQGTSWSTPIELSTNTGIGGDIATDKAGKIYHVWPQTGGGSIQMNRSTNGGDSFGSITMVADTNASFDYPIPCFDNRLAFIYTSVAVDLSNGPFANRVYVCWNDTNGPESGTPANNHSKITVVYSADGGDSWTEVNPHSLADINTVDRFNPWLDVDTDGSVHVVFYSTQNDPNRLKPDMYHTLSEDGGVTWSAPVRITATSSNYINGSFQWGDYNGMSVVDGQIRPIWTDNRSSVRVYTADMETLSGTQDFSLELNATESLLCGANAMQPLDLTIQPIDGFNGSVTFSFSPALPSGLSGSFSPNPATPGQTVTVSVSNNGSATNGIVPLTILGQSSLLSHDIGFNLDVQNVAIGDFWAAWTLANPFQMSLDTNGNGLIDILDLVGYQVCVAP